MGRDEQLGEPAMEKLQLPTKQNIVLDVPPKTASSTHQLLLKLYRKISSSRLGKMDALARASQPSEYTTSPFARKPRAPASFASLKEVSPPANISQEAGCLEATF